MPHLADEINYGVDKLVHPNYTYQQILPLNGTQFQPLDTTGGQLTQFELPPNSCYNLSKSYIEFDFTPPASAANRFNWIHCNGFPF